MIKASAGGGGKGMRIAYSDTDVETAYRLSKSEALSSFGDDRLLVEKYIEEPRHIEIQILGDKTGQVFWLPERECSIQRRNQKVVEEAPSSFLTPQVRKAMGEQAVQLAKRVGYDSAGTCEFLVDKHRKFYFLEMNTRLQVEHPITECVSGLDLVHAMIHSSTGVALPLTQDQTSRINGWAIESRVYAEDPEKYLPSIGRLSSYQEPKGDGVRCDSGIREGDEISVYYDPMICKLVTYGATRQETIERMKKALDEYVVEGVTSNLGLLRDIVSQPKFAKGDTTTKFLPDVYGKGFKGYELKGEEEVKVASFVGVMHCMRDEKQRTFIEGGDKQDKKVWDVVVKVGTEVSMRVEKAENGRYVVDVNGSKKEVSVDWAVESSLARFKDGENEVVIQFVDRKSMHYKISYRGTKVCLSVWLD